MIEKDKIVNLVVVAHPDDEILGFGGTGYELVKRGEIVQPIILSGGANVRSLRPSDEELYAHIEAANSTLGFNKPILGNFPNIKMNSVDHLDLVQFIEKYIEQFNPTRIFTHHPGDLNNDHTQVSKACLAASRLFQRRETVKPLESLYFMEIQSSTDWNFSIGSDDFKAQVFFEIEHSLDKKIEALSKYENVMRDFPHPRSRECLEGVAAYRGGQSGNKYAEAFQLVFQRGIGNV